MSLAGSMSWVCARRWSSPADGVIGRFVTEPGDPVEYGQELVALIAASGAA